jgi:phospholipid/cholesterol/gamma-HCH transport system substrate-binding protein
VYQFNRPQNNAFPRAKLWLDYTFLQHFYATTGVDDFLNRWSTAARPGGRPFSIGTDVFFGLGLFFNDEDMKTLLSSGVAGAAASAAK